MLLKLGELVLRKTTREVGILFKVVTDPLDGCCYLDILFADGLIRCAEKECCSLPGPPLYLLKGDLKNNA